MAKKRKTKEQKIIAQLRHKLTVQQPNEEVPTHPTHIPEKFTYNIPAINPPVPKSSPHIVDIAYVKKDLFKTVILSACILFSQLLMYFFLVKHIIHISTLQY